MIFIWNYCISIFYHALFLLQLVRVWFLLYATDMSIFLEIYIKSCIIIQSIFFPFQNSEILSRKSSASSTGSLDRNNEKLKNSSRNTPQIANSVKAKIAMFSSSPPNAPSSIGSNSSNESSLTRSLTHSDVRFEDPGAISGK